MKNIFFTALGYLFFRTFIGKGIDGSFSKVSYQEPIRGNTDIYITVLYDNLDVSTENIFIGWGESNKEKLYIYFPHQESTPHFFVTSRAYGITNYPTVIIGKVLREFPFELSQEKIYEGITITPQVLDQILLDFQQQ